MASHVKNTMTRMNEERDNFLWQKNLANGANQKRTQMSSFCTIMFIFMKEHNDQYDWINHATLGWSKDKMISIPFDLPSTDKVNRVATWQSSLHRYDQPLITMKVIPHLLIRFNHLENIMLFYYRIDNV